MYDVLTKHNDKDAECDRQDNALKGTKWHDSSMVNNREVIADVMNAFGPLPVSETQLKRLQTYSKQVLPIKYYTCPIGWNEYTEPDNAETQKTGVIWMTERGTFCQQTGDESKLVDSFMPLKKVDDMRAINEEIINLTHAMAMQLPEGDELRKKDQLLEDVKERRRTVKSSLKTQEMDSRKNASITELMKILHGMEEYKYLAADSKELRKHATEYFKKAKSCAVSNGQCGTTDETRGCEQEEDIAGSWGEKICVPKDLKKTIDASLDEFADASDKKSAARLANWWSNFYAAENQEKRAKKHKLYNMLARPSARRSRSVEYSSSSEEDD